MDIVSVPTLAYLIAAIVPGFFIYWLVAGDSMGWVTYKDLKYSVLVICGYLAAICLVLFLLIWGTAYMLGLHLLLWAVVMLMYISACVGLIVFLVFKRTLRTLI